MALETLDVLTELLPVIRQRSDYFRAQLNELCSKLKFVREVRVGLMIGIELKMPGKQLVTDALEAGLLINCTHDSLRFLPPFIISEKRSTWRSGPAEALQEGQRLLQELPEITAGLGALPSSSLTNFPTDCASSCAR